MQEFLSRQEAIDSVTLNQTLGMKARTWLLFALTVLLLASGAFTFRGEPIVGEWVAMYPLPASPARFFSSNSRLLPDRMEFRRDGTYVWKIGTYSATLGVWRLDPKQTPQMRTYECLESGVIVARVYRHTTNAGNVPVFCRPLWYRPEADVETTDGFYVSQETPLSGFWRRVTGRFP